MCAPLPADCPPASAPPALQERYNEISSEMKHMLVRVGWKPDFVEKSVPVLPISGWMGDNLIKKSTNMTWWNGCDVEAPDGAKVHIETLLDAMNTFVQVGRGGVGEGLPDAFWLCSLQLCRLALAALLLPAPTR